jgi:two-component system, NarL family, sensor kinase
MDTNETKIYISVLIGLSVLVILVVFFIVTIIRYQRKKVAFDLGELKAGFSLLDEDRKRIACDLHDDLGSSLSFLKHRLQCLSNLKGEDVEIVEAVDFHLDQMMKKIRRISFNMMPGILTRMGLDEALKELIDIMTDSTKIKVHYRCSTGSFGEGYDIHIYRIAQEILNNIAKHSKATVVSFTILKTNQKIELRVKDNGIGFHKSILNGNPAGLGLNNISARTDLLKGNIYLEAMPGKGVDYLIEIPI